MNIIDMTAEFDDSLYPARANTLITDFIVHHAETTYPTSLDAAKQQLRNIHAFHKGPDRGWPGIAYHRAVWQDNYFLLRSRNKNGWHTGGMDIEPRNGIGDGNDHGLACVLLGNFTRTTPDSVTLQTVAEGKDWDEQQLGRTITLSGHMDWVPTACPGEGWDWWKYSIVVPNAPPEPDPIDVDHCAGLRTAMAHTFDVVVVDALNAHRLATGGVSRATADNIIFGVNMIREQFIGPRQT